jgi:hypothetical protein
MREPRGSSSALDRAVTPGDDSPSLSDLAVEPGDYGRIATARLIRQSAIDVSAEK